MFGFDLEHKHNETETLIMVDFLTTLTNALGMNGQAEGPVMPGGAKPKIVNPNLPDEPATFGQLLNPRQSTDPNAAPGDAKPPLDMSALSPMLQGLSGGQETQPRPLPAGNANVMSGRGGINPGAFSAPNQIQNPALANNIFGKGMF